MSVAVICESPFGTFTPTVADRAFPTPTRPTFTGYLADPADTRTVAFQATALELTTGRTMRTVPSACGCAWVSRSRPVHAFGAGASRETTSALDTIGTVAPPA